MASIVLPELKLLLKSKYSSYVVCGCKIVKLILKSFGPVIKSNVTAPPSHGGVDIMREERWVLLLCCCTYTLMYLSIKLFACRYEKCHTCYSHLTSLREDILRLPSKVVREQGLLDAFSVLE